MAEVHFKKEADETTLVPVLNDATTSRRGFEYTEQPHPLEDGAVLLADVVVVAVLNEHDEGESDAGGQPLVATRDSGWREGDDEPLGHEPPVADGGGDDGGDDTDPLPTGGSDEGGERRRRREAEETAAARLPLPAQEIYDRLISHRHALAGHNPTFRIIEPAEDSPPEEKAEIVVHYDERVVHPSGHEEDKTFVFSLVEPEVREDIRELPVDSPKQPVAYDRHGVCRDQSEVSQLTESYIEKALKERVPAWAERRDPDILTGQAYSVDSEEAEQEVTLHVTERTPLAATAGATEPKSIVDMVDQETYVSFAAIERVYDPDFVEGWRSLAQAGVPVPRNIIVCEQQKRIVVEDVCANGRAVYGKAYEHALCAAERYSDYHEGVFVHVFGDKKEEIRDLAQEYADAATNANVELPDDSPFELWLLPDERYGVVVLDPRRTNATAKSKVRYPLTPEQLKAHNDAAVKEFLESLHRIHQLLPPS